MATGEPAAHPLDAVPHGDLRGCLVIGYYGGGNYGDELLLEVVLRHLRRSGVDRAAFIYQDPGRYATYHDDYGYTLVDARSRGALLRALLRARSVVVGGGGLWGRDATRASLLLGTALLLARRVLGKPVYLLGVGYYRSTGRAGRLGARLAAAGSDLILARDEETLANFGRHSGRVRLDTDLAWCVDDRDLAGYDAGVAAIDRRVALAADEPPAVLVGLRRFDPAAARRYAAQVERLIAAFPRRRFVLATLQSPQFDSPEHDTALRLRRQYGNVSVLEFVDNPLALYAWLRQRRDRLIMVAPQYHAIVSAHRNGIPLLPMTYDNKVDQLLAELGYRRRFSYYTVPFDVMCDFVADPAAYGPRRMQPSR